MDIIYEFIFLGLTDRTQDSRVQRPIRILLAIFLSVMFIISIVTLGIYAVFAVDQGMLKRLISAFLLLVIARYYINLLKAIKKTNNKHLN